jgi:FkbM family methyltransferase
MDVAFRILRRFGLDVRRVRKHPGIADFLAQRKVQVVYDIGANVGQFGLAVRRRGYAGKIVSFEPVSYVFEELKHLAQRDGNWEVARYAVGSENGSAQINVSRNSQFSSIKPLAERSSTTDADSAFTSSESVEVRPLDDLVGANGPYFIKIDTQGFEREVLAGGPKALAGATGVLLELPVINIYDDVWTLHEAVGHMREIGFIPSQFEPVGHHQSDPMAAIEFDCLFRKRTPGID